MNFKRLAHRALSTVLLGVSALSLQAHAQGKELVVGSSATYRPFAYESPTKEIIGYDVDIIRAVAQKAGVLGREIVGPEEEADAAPGGHSNGGALLRAIGLGKEEFSAAAGCSHPDPPLFAAKGRVLKKGKAQHRGEPRNGAIVIGDEIGDERKAHDHSASVVERRRVVNSRRRREDGGDGMGSAVALG